MDVAESVPVGKTVAGAADADVATELSTEVTPTAVLDGSAADGPVIREVPLVAEAVADAETPDVKVIGDEVIPEALIPVPVGWAVSVPLVAGVEVGAALPVPEMIELDPVSIGGAVVVSVPLPAGVVVGALPETVGVLVISGVEVGALPPVDPKMLERMLPRPVESEVAEATTDSVGVGVTRTPVEGIILAMIDDKTSEGARSVGDAAAEESTPVLGPVIPAVESGRRLLRSAGIKSGAVVVDAAAEE
jgi:hypothetical protein